MCGIKNVVKLFELTHEKTSKTRENVKKVIRRKYVS